MAKLALNKTTLNKEGRRLKAFKQFVPALDLKRKQLLSARQEAVAALANNQQQLALLQQQVVEQLPMSADSKIDLNSLIQVKQLSINYVNLVGLELPKLAVFEVEIAKYSVLLLPHWVDDFLNLQTKALRTEIEVKIYQQRLELLELGLQKTTQRLNLFDKVLIPEAQKNIRKIRIALSDAERAGVVRAKIAKNKRRRMQL
ncbi:MULTISPECIES: V-type ATP synthase subunit D [unclassified Neptuniibacter]|uniref:V-type ATP synthase subunit D n=1 Tax=unclassified Neptuniibacter TaxID=2630693 RepID=UPI0026E2F6F3|nr:MULTISPECIES: V-type ATP synthase subunit D [unclassified Neptuniibacter]MDO6513773.1 V-type ATP synthase subunit D [Neptuniibacter sp. 2_MG-2023]MDO6593266.1 V-type ATP synthase subunit D [Neptuniibacter sp. 1_MG-2023]